MYAAASIVESVPMGWTWAIAILCGLLFPVSFYPVVKKPKNRLGLLGASCAGLVISVFISGLRGNSLSRTLFIYADAMICLAIVAVVVWAAERKKFGASWDLDDWRRFGTKIAILGMVPLVALMVLVEFGLHG
jgi:peptidoglycan/LPS O-acetylase OafA/YrhL